MHSGDSSGRKSVENILFRNLKSRIRHSVGDEIQQEIKKRQSEGPDLSLEHIIQSVFQKMCSEETFHRTSEAFVEDVKIILECSNCQGFENTVFGDNLVSRSLSGSFSSLNSSSIDFLSFEKLNNLFQTLLHSSPIEQLEALETLCRLSTLEHVTKQSVWPDIHSTLLELMLYSDLNFVKEGCVRVFVKMLSSHEPKVVNEGFHGLIDFFCKYLQADAIGLEVPLLTNDFVGQVFVLINKFSREIPSHWLRYPHKVMEDIVQYSVHILDCSLTSNAVNFFVRFDIQAMWLKNYMYGSIGRSLLFSAFQEKTHVLNIMIEECDKFLSNESFNFEKCCDNIAVSNLIHNVCFLSHFLKYRDGRTLLKGLYGLDSTWIDVFDIVMGSVWKLNNEICISCSNPALETIPNVFTNLWDYNDTKESCVMQKLLHILTIPLERQINPKGFCMFALCFCEILQHPSAVKYLADFQIRNTAFMLIVIQESLTVVASLSLDYHNSLHILACNLCLTQRVLLIPSTMFVDSTAMENMNFYYKMLSGLISKLNNMAMDDSSNSDDKIQRNICLQQCLQTCFIFLQKPLGLITCMKYNSYSAFLNLLLDGVKITLPYKDTSCLHCITSLAFTLSYNLNFNVFLTDENISKLSEIIWNRCADETVFCVDEMLENGLKNLMPAIANKYEIVNKFVDNESKADPMIQLVEFVLLCPVIKSIYLSHEHNILMLHVLSILIYDVHIVCMLQCRFEIQRLLIEYMYDYVLTDDSFLIDDLSILLNYCIVKLYSIGGPTECILPPKHIRNVEEHYLWPLTISYPPCLVYFNIDGDELQVEEATSNSGNDEVLEINLCQFQEQFIDCLKAGRDQFYGISEFLNKSLNYINVSSELLCSVNGDINKEKEEISNEIVLAGIRLACGYGSILTALPENSNSEKDLAVLFQTCKELLVLDNYVQFDVFISTIFLLFKGNLNDSWQFLQTFSQCPNSLFIWEQCGMHYFRLKDCSVHLHNALLLEFCNFVIMDDLSTVFSAFQICDSLPSVIYDHWMTRCFWNYLDLLEIGNFITLVVLFGTEYSVYYFASILKHLKVEICRQSYSYNLISFLKESNLSGYKLSLYIEYIVNLAAKYEASSKNILQHVTL